MKGSMFIVFAIAVFTATVNADTTDNDAVSDAYAEYYKQYYETTQQHSDEIPYHLQTADDRNPYGQYSIDKQFIDMNFLGPDTPVLIAISSLALGVLNTIAYIAIDSRVKDLESDQDSICTTAKGIGNLAPVAAAGTPTKAEFNAVVTLLTGIATPTC